MTFQADRCTFWVVLDPDGRRVDTTMWNYPERALQECQRLGDGHYIETSDGDPYDESIGYVLCHTCGYSWWGGFHACQGDPADRYRQSRSYGT
jgi:hypothetical protein